MTNEVPDQHVHVHPHSLSRVFAIEKKTRKAVFFLKHAHSVCTNKEITERQDE